MFKLGRHEIGHNQPTYIIAEIGINHCGNFELAKKMMESAVQCGANCVKFQKREISRILTKEGLDKPYINDNSFGSTYGEHKKALEFSYEDFKKLKLYADKLNVDFSASGWDEISVDFLDEIGVPFFKMASADLTNIPLLEHTAKKGKPIILSTGMANMDMVTKAVETVTRYNTSIVLMQCTSSYPAPFKDLNISVIKTYYERFPQCVIGYSSHCLGIAVPLATIVLGAKVLECHFTLDRTMKGSDQAASLEPEGFKKLIRDIRAVELAMGNGIKEICTSELSCIQKLRKSVVTAKPIKKGEIIYRDMLTVKGPGTGICPSHIDDLVGKISMQDIDEDVVVTEKMIFM